MGGVGTELETLLQRYLAEPMAEPGGRLERLLGDYLADQSGGSAEPPDTEVDALLLRYVLDKEDVGAELLEALEGRGSVSGPVGQRVGPEDLVRYVRNRAIEDEELHAMTSDESPTLRGIAPGGSGPIPPRHRSRR